MISRTGIGIVHSVISITLNQGAFVTNVGRNSDWIIKIIYYNGWEWNGH